MEAKGLSSSAEHRVHVNISTLVRNLLTASTPNEAVIVTTVTYSNIMTNYGEGDFPSDFP